MPTDESFKCLINRLCYGEFQFSTGGSLIEMKKIISFILTLIMVLTSTLFFSACDGKTSAKTLAMFDANKANFILIRPKEANTNVVNTTKYFSKAILDTHDIKVDIKSDNVKPQEDRLEINIGLTNREYSKKLYDEVVNSKEHTVMDFAISVKGDEIFIVGASDMALQSAVEYYLSHFCAYTTGAIPDNYSYFYRMTDDNAKLTINGSSDISKYKIVIPRYGMSYVIGREIESLQTALAKATGCSVEVISDKDKETDYEIIIGETKRGNAPIPTNTDEFILKMDDKKIYINGATDACTAMAIKEFCLLLNDKLIIDKDFNYVGSYSYSKKSSEDKDSIYSISFEDEFNKLDNSIWRAGNGLARRTKAGDPQYFTTEEKNLRVEDGKLVMHADYDSNGYYGSEIRTDRSLWFKYGLAEIKCKYNNNDGLVSAFWLLGMEGTGDAHGEIDIFESYAFPNKLRTTSIAWAHNNHTKFSSDIEYGDFQPSRSEVTDLNSDFYKKVFYELDEGDTFDDEWHTIGCEWDADAIRWVMDGRVFLEIDTNANERSIAAFHGYMQLILTQYSNINVFPKIQKDASAATDWKNNHFTIDKVTLYQLPGQKIKKMF